MSDADLGRALTRAFDAAITGRSADAMSTLRTHTAAVATVLRRMGVAPERAVVALKAMLRGHGGRGWAPSIAPEHGAAPVTAASLVYGALFTWWVAAYYAEDPREASYSLVVAAAGTA